MYTYTLMGKGKAGSVSSSSSSLSMLLCNSLLIIKTKVIGEREAAVTPLTTRPVLLSVFTEGSDWEPKHRGLPGLQHRSCGLGGRLGGPDTDGLLSRYRYCTRKRTRCLRQACGTYGPRATFDLLSEKLTDVKLLLLSEYFNRWFNNKCYMCCFFNGAAVSWWFGNPASNRKVAGSIPWVTTIQNRS